MSVETTRETKEQQVSSVEEDSPKQSEPDIELPDDDPNKPTPSTVDINSIILGVNKVSKESFPQLLKLLSRNELTYEQFDSMCTQKFIAMMTASKYWRKYRSELQSFKKREKIWQSKYTSLFRQIKDMETIVNAYKQELQSNEYASPHKITGTVGLPAVACPKKKDSIKLPKQAIPMPKPDPVSISVEDDDDVVILEFEKEVTASSSTSKITNTTTKKQKDKHSTSKTLVVSPKNVTRSPKTVTAAKPLNPINIGTTIDLTGNDDVIEESNIVDLEDSTSPIEIPCRIPALLLPEATSNEANHPCNKLNSFRNEDELFGNSHSSENLNSTDKLNLSNVHEKNNFETSIMSTSTDVTSNFLKCYSDTNTIQPKNVKKRKLSDSVFEDKEVDCMLIENKLPKVKNAINDLKCKNINDDSLEQTILLKENQTIFYFHKDGKVCKDMLNSINKKNCHSI